MQSSTNGNCEALVDFDRLDQIANANSNDYRRADPYPHAVIDGVLPVDVFERACCEFDIVEKRERWTSYLHVNERKYAHREPGTWGPTLHGIARAMTSDRFLGWLEALTGYDKLLADWSMDGGGLHRSLRGGFLNVHTDFTAHHSRPNWRRRVNILLYLNAEWREEWGGHLELWNVDRTECVERVAPLGNRMIVFTTSEHSYHGHPDPMQCPETVARQSLALYYFQEQESPLRQATDYRARPNDGLKSAAIYLDKKLLSTYDVIKRRLGLSDDFASNALDRLNRIISRRR